jgi:hypothetical protein
MAAKTLRTGITLYVVTSNLRTIVFGKLNSIQVCLCLLWNLKEYYSVCNSPSLVLRNPVDICPVCLISILVLSSYLLCLRSSFLPSGVPVPSDLVMLLMTFTCEALIWTYVSEFAKHSREAVSRNIEPDTVACLCTALGAWAYRLLCHV